MCRLNQLTAERSKWTTELDETKNERNEMKEKLKNTEENHKVELMEMENVCLLLLYLHSCFVLAQTVRSKKF